MLRRGGEEPADVPAGRKMPTVPAQDDHAHGGVRVERLEGELELIALRHADNVVGRAGENDVRAFVRDIDLDSESVQVLQ